MTNKLYNTMKAVKSAGAKVLAGTLVTLMGYGCAGVVPQPIQKVDKCYGMPLCESVICDIVINGSLNNSRMDEKICRELNTLRDICNESPLVNDLSQWMRDNECPRH